MTTFRSDDQGNDERVPRRKIPDNKNISSEEREGAEWSPPSSIRTYSEECPFDDTGDILHFNKKSYKVSLSVGLMTSKM